MHVVHATAIAPLGLSWLNKHLSNRTCRPLNKCKGQITTNLQWQITTRIRRQITTSLHQQLTVTHPQRITSSLRQQLTTTHPRWITTSLHQQITTGLHAGLRRQITTGLHCQGMIRPRRRIIQIIHGNQLGILLFQHKPSLLYLLQSATEGPSSTCSLFSRCKPCNSVT